MNALDSALATVQPLSGNKDTPIKMAVLAMGGQGGGVFCDWVVALAERAGWAVQATSVPGVAQRTGATIYYLEMIESAPGRTPVLALTPTQGDVDIVVAAEWMEAGRSILRGLSTPDRTTIIASSHRSLAVGEKEKPGEGTGDPTLVVDALKVAAQRVVAFDMESLAQQAGSVISAVLFGALAGSNVLPFPREDFENVIRAQGRGTEPSLRAFALGYAQTNERTAPVFSPDVAPAPSDSPETPTGHAVLDALVSRLGDLPPPARAMARVGVERLVDFQDPAYASDYLDRLSTIAALDLACDGARHDYVLTATAAKYLARAMAYDDVIRVADLKTRASRFARVRRESAAPDGTLVTATEYMHPRAQEIVGLLPARIGARVAAHSRAMATIETVFSRGRHIRTDALIGFLPLFALASLRRWRRGTLRHAHEVSFINDWLSHVQKHAPTNYALAVEILAAQRLVKGYSDTHARGQSKFARVIGALDLLAQRADGGQWMNRLIRAALMDEDGKALDEALKTIETLEEVPA